ncbi:MAG TPA: chemotaxis protein CheW [Thermoanaerobaculia bacterium]|jgi:chemotaxis signal transduction protein|nr:chemotaxis protein CheW [Thermoanaerobaculia bacterium]
MLVFMLGGRSRALSIGMVAAVAEIGAVTRLPSASPCNIGVIVHRGAVLPLVDVGRGLDGKPTPAGTGAPPVCIITRSEPVIAFPVEAVLGLQALPAEAPAAGPSWDVLDALIRDLTLDLALDQDPAD